MGKVRIYDLAKQLGKNNKDIITVLTEMGLNVKSHSSTIDGDVAQKVEQRLTEPSQPKEPAKPAQTSQPKPTTEAPKPQQPQPQRLHQPQGPAPNRPPYSHQPPQRLHQPRPAQPGGQQVLHKPAQGQQGQGQGQGQAKRPPQQQQQGSRPAIHKPAPNQGGGHKRPPHQPYNRPQQPGGGGQQQQGRPQSQGQTQQPGQHHKKHAPRVIGKELTTSLAAAFDEREPVAEMLPEEVTEMKVPERFKKDIQGEKMEKFKVKPGMQRAFQAIRKIDHTKRPAQPAFTKKGPDRFGHNRQMEKQQVITGSTAPRKKTLKIQEGITVKEFAELISVKIGDVIKEFMKLGYAPTLNQPIDSDAAMLVADALGVKLELVQPEDIMVEEEEAEVHENLLHRPPIVTIMGHVDHGKTSLLDAIRETRVIDTEAGGITQHIGAYKVKLKDKEIAFLDTPGHEAFTALRARGAKVTDIVILVVAADDGVKPQTIEAIDHAKAAEVPIIVAVNKIDKPEADPQRVRTELSHLGILSEDWGGTNIFAEISAKKRIGIESLLELILLQAEMLELKANPNRPAKGVIIEAKLDKGRGPVATVLVQNGTLKNGDVFISGVNTGRVRVLFNDMGHKIEEAGPSTPVEVIGFNNVPSAGDAFAVMDDERKARQIAMSRQEKLKASEVAKKSKLTLEDLYIKIKEGNIRDLNIIIKGDVQGSVEAIRDAMVAIKHEEVQVRVIHSAVGGINESDVMLAAASQAIIIGFNVRPDTKASQIAEAEGVDIELYNIIYEAIDDVKKALEGLIKPTIKEKILGRAEVRQIYQVTRFGTIAGCMVVDGLISRNCEGIRIIRDNIVVYEGKLGSLKRFKDDAKEVQQGYECGITIERFNDMKAGDIIENFVHESIAGKLSS